MREQNVQTGLGSDASGKCASTKSGHSRSLTDGCPGTVVVPATLGIMSNAAYAPWHVPVHAASSSTAVVASAAALKAIDTSGTSAMPEVSVGISS